MLRIKKSNSLRPSQLSSIEKLGEKVGANKKLNRIIFRCNQYISKNRMVALPLIFLATLLMVIASFFVVRPLKNNVLPTPEELPVIYNSTSKEYQQLIQEGITISDSIKYLLDRGQLTYEDSVYIGWGVTYINNIKNLTEQNEEKIQSKKD